LSQLIETFEEQFLLDVYIILKDIHPESREFVLVPLDDDPGILLENELLQ
jgi:hypothetical protein